jgi:hypothetical protein
MIEFLEKSAAPFNRLRTSCRPIAGSAASKSAMFSLRKLPIFVGWHLFHS